jgi:hypothetical protein
MSYQQPFPIIVANTESGNQKKSLIFTAVGAVVSITNPIYEFNVCRSILRLRCVDHGFDEVFLCCQTKLVRGTQRSQPSHLPKIPRDSK